VHLVASVARKAGRWPAPTVQYSWNGLKAVAAEVAVVNLALLVLLVLLVPLVLLVLLVPLVLLALLVQLLLVTAKLVLMYSHPHQMI
jgi:hypothetical protein